MSSRVLLLRAALLLASLAAVPSLAVEVQTPIQLPFYDSYMNAFPGDYISLAGALTVAASPSKHRTNSLSLAAGVDRTMLRIAQRTNPKEDLRISFYLHSEGVGASTSFDMSLEYTGNTPGTVTQFTVSIFPDRASIIDASGTVTEAFFARPLSSATGTMQLFQLDYVWTPFSHSFSLSYNGDVVLAGTSGAPGPGQVRLAPAECGFFDCYFSGLVMGSSAAAPQPTIGTYFMDVLHVSDGYVTADNTNTINGVAYYGVYQQSPLAAKAVGIDSTDFLTSPDLLALHSGNSLRFRFTDSAPHAFQVFLQWPADPQPGDGFRIVVDGKDGVIADFEIAGSLATVTVDPRGLAGPPDVRTITHSATELISNPLDENQIRVPLFWDDNTFSVIVNGRVILEREPSFTTMRALLAVELVGSGLQGARLMQMTAGAACLDDPAVTMPGVLVPDQTTCVGSLYEYDCDFRCDEGYAGAEYLGCGPDEFDTPTWYGGCDPSYCFDLDGEYDPWTWTTAELGAEASLECPDDMEVFPEGRDAIACVAVAPGLASWAPAPGQCRRKRCSAPSIPNIAHNCDGLLRGESCTYQCAFGFEMAPGTGFNASTDGVELVCGLDYDWEPVAEEARLQWPPTECVPKFREVLVSLDTYDAAITFGGDRDLTAYPVPPETPAPAPVPGPAPGPILTLMAESDPSGRDPDAIISLFRHENALALDRDLIVGGKSLGETLQDLQVSVDVLNTRLRRMEQRFKGGG